MEKVQTEQKTHGEWWTQVWTTLKLVTIFGGGLWVLGVAIIVSEVRAMRSAPLSAPAGRGIP